MTARSDTWAADGAAVDLFWLPLGAGGHFVRMNGKAYEALAALLGRRARCDLYHSALEVRLAGRRSVIEMAPIFDAPPERRGVVATGAVGARWAGRLRLFQYGIRLWPEGEIPDVAEAVDSPQRLTSDPRRTGRLLDLVPEVPTPVWGRDTLGTGDMWNSNSVIAWLIVRSGIDPGPLQPPAGGRAPGWTAGLVVARRQNQAATRRASGAAPVIASRPSWTSRPQSASPSCSAASTDSSKSTTTRASGS